MTSFDQNARVHIFDYTDPILGNEYEMNILLGLVQYEYFDKIDLNSFIVLKNPQYSYYTEINNVAFFVKLCYNNLSRAIHRKRRNHYAEY